MKRILILLVPILIISCAPKEEDVLVNVDGSRFTVKDFEKYIPADKYKNLNDADIKSFLDNWAEQEILYLEAQKREIDKEDSVKLVFEQYRKNLLAMEVVRREFGGTTVSEAEIMDYFERHKDEFLYAVKLAQIVLPNYEIAARTLEEINAGADFFKLAEERSLTKPASSAEVITNYLPRGTIADFATEEIIFSLKTGKVSGVIPYLQGTYLIVKVIDRKKVKAKVDLEEYRPQIYNYLLSKKYQKFLTQFVDSLKSQYKITIDLSPLKS